MPCYAWFDIWDEPTMIFRAGRNILDSGAKTALIMGTAASLLAVSSAHAAVMISAKPTAFMKCTNGVCKPTAKSATFNATDLQNMLASGDVTVTTAGAK